MDIDIMFKDVMIARKAIVDAVKESGIPKGKMKCPICASGELLYTQAVGYNDHVHAQCTTKNCVSWME